VRRLKKPKFRRIQPAIWGDQHFRALSRDAQLLYFFLWTHPNMTSVGAMRGTLQGLAAELGWEPKAFREAFREGLREGFFEFDEEASYVGLPTFLVDNYPQSPNVVKAWVSSFDYIPECELKNLLYQRVEAFAEGFGKAFHKAFQEGFREAFAKPSRNKNKKKKLETEAPTPLPPPSQARAGADGVGKISLPREPDEFQDIWSRHPVPEFQAGDPEKTARTFADVLAWNHFDVQLFRACQDNLALDIEARGGLEGWTAQHKGTVPTLHWFLRRNRFARWAPGTYSPATSTSQLEELTRDGLDED